MAAKNGSDTRRGETSEDPPAGGVLNSTMTSERGSTTK